MITELIKSSRLRVWLAIVGSGTLLLGTAYAMVQQSTRLSADDLPLQTAQTAKHQLEAGAEPTMVVPAVKTELRTDATIFLAVTDSSQKVLANSATLDNQPTLPPQGTFDYTAKHGSDHFTWQPVSGVREATRIIKYKDGFIVAGQSLKPYEDRVGTYGLLAVTGWLAMAIWSYVLILLPSKKPTAI